MIFIINSSTSPYLNLWFNPETGTIHTQDIASGEFEDQPQELIVWGKDDIPF